MLKNFSRQSDIIVTSLIDFFKLNTDPRFDEAKLKELTKFGNEFDRAIKLKEKYFNEKQKK